jgi:hypothetical protein
LCFKGLFNARNRAAQLHLHITYGELCAIQLCYIQSLRSHCAPSCWFREEFTADFVSCISCA